jgi:Replication-relaxation
MSRPVRPGSRQLRRLREELAERDIGVLQSVATLRFLTARQIEDLHFADHATSLTAARVCRRVLERLTSDRLLGRLDRRVGGIRAGSASFVYCLCPAGDRVIRDGQVRRRAREPSRTFLDHTLAVAQVVVDLTAAARRGEIEVLRLETEPACWRTVQASIAGDDRLKPDLFVALAVGDYEYRWFVEVDRGTESIATLIRKSRLYDSYYRTGHEQHEYGVFPQVIWLVDTERRLSQLKEALGRDGRLAQGLFLVVPAGDAVKVLSGEAP